MGMSTQRLLEKEYRERVMRAVAHIEANLGNPLSLEEAAERASWSYFHFHRVFSAVIGVPPGEYLRMRRLTEGTRLLALRSLSIAAIAERVGFGSVEAFHRSFKAEFGKTPAEYRRSSGNLALMNPFTPVERPLVHIAGCLAGEPVIERFGPVRLLCAREEFVLEQPALSMGIYTLWERNWNLLVSAAGQPLVRQYGLAEPSPGSAGKAIVYYAGVEAREGVPEDGGLVPYVIPEGEYLRALHRGPSSKLNETYLYLYGTWLPRHGREPGMAMDFDVYDERYDNDNRESPLSEVTFRIPLAPA